MDNVVQSYRKTMDKSKPLMVSLLIPAKDEEETIGKLLQDIHSVLMDNKEYRWEVLVIVDHCVDNTEKIAKQNKATVIYNNDPPGKGNALQAGFVAASGNILIMLDADYSHKPEDIPSFLTPFCDEKIGMVIGSRSLGGSEEYTFIRTLGNIFLTACVNSLFHLKLTDSLNGFKAFRKEVILNHFSSSTFEIEIELIYNTLLQNLSIIEIPSHERERAGGEMKSRALIHGPKFLLCIISKGFLFNLKRMQFFWK